MGRDINELSVAEKRGLEPLVRSRYSTVISQLRDTEKHDIGELVKKIAKKFKVGAALAKLRQHKDAVEQIKKAIIGLGFEIGAYDEAVVDLTHEYNTDTGAQEVDYKKPAGKMYYNMTKARPDIAGVEKQRDKAVADLWLTTHKKDARKLVEAKIEVPKLELK